MANLTGFPDTHVILFTCKECDSIERIEYMAEIEENGTLFTGWYRLGDKGEKIYWKQDERCPQCNKYRRSGGLKITVSSKRTCDDRCRDARSTVCICSCGGKNHAKKYEKPPVVQEVCR